jgi:hypothetical protein
MISPNSRVELVMVPISVAASKCTALDYRLKPAVQLPIALAVWRTPTAGNAYPEPAQRFL